MLPNQMPIVREGEPPRADRWVSSLTANRTGFFSAERGLPAGRRPQEAHHHSKLHDGPQRWTLLGREKHP